ncbi:MAG: efflux RND transporter periplasmic adaptor subunit [Candidatus Poribacteria bacterium]|nr:efflux RND transporter periplasmic adaptor subunit [Candidatus Poribacteria bacterium]MDE0506948.1 efflux RND transporter periplasmic adaptor subunit [Candidatus Poribacteria bacterium]
MLRSRLTLVLAISVIVTAGLVLLNVTRTSTWAQDSGAHAEKANHTHNAKNDSHSHGERNDHSHGARDDSHSHDGNEDSHSQDQHDDHKHGTEDDGHVHGKGGDHSHATGEDSHVRGEDASHSHDEDDSFKLTDKAKANIGLKTAETDVRAIERGVQVTGNVIPHPSGQIHVTPRIGGIVKNIHFSLGDSPNEGDVLLELDSIDLQMAQIDLIEAVAQQKSLVAKLERLTEVFAKQIRRELQTRQIDYLQSLSELEQLGIAVEKRKALAAAKTISVLEQMRFRLVKADVELTLLETTLKRIETLAEKQISARKELVAQQAKYKKGKNEFADVKRQFQILGINEQILEKILLDGGETPILSLLDIGSIGAATTVESTPDALLEKYAMLNAEGMEFVDSKAAYKIAAIKVASNRQRALAAGLSDSLLDNLARTASIVSFNDLSAAELIETYLAFVESSEALEGLLQMEEILRGAVITLTKIRQKLQVWGLTFAEIEKIVQTGQPSPSFYVKAPASGQIVKQHVTLGSTVAKSDVLFSILDTDIVWVEGEAYEDTLALLQQKFQVGSDVRIRVTAYPGTTFTGKISHISDAMNPEKRTVHFWAEVDNSAHQLKPGMFAEQTIVLEKVADVLSVPLNAVLEEGGSRYVFVEHGAAYTKQEVVVGEEDDRFIEIKNGLSPGDHVVVQGQHQLLRASANIPEAHHAHAGHSH